MLTEERKAFLSDVVVKFKELEGWCRNLSSEEDLKFLRSQGFSGIRLNLIVWVFIPLLVAIQTSFQGVPYLVSFFKRRLKRRVPSEKVKKGLRTRQKQYQRSKGTLRCCKSCKDVHVKRIVRSRFFEEKKKTVEGKNPTTRRNYLRRLKKKILRDVLDDLKPVNEVSMVDLDMNTPSEPRLRKKRQHLLNRKFKRSKLIHSGDKIVSRDGLIPFLKKLDSVRPPAWTEKHVLAYFTPTEQGCLLENGVDVLPDLISQSPFVEHFLFSFRMNWKSKFAKEWALVHARVLGKGLVRSSRQSSSLSFNVSTDT
jgi:hypothetical protein